ncbi:MAG: cupin domain-containing protein [Fimbriimonadaceae bacterium]|nr:cupin domain-containing protein [Fimbriimonadaceae bacterium]
MILRGIADPAQAGRVVYDITGHAVELRHFVIRETTADRPFAAHSHAAAEFWFILDGHGTLLLADRREAVGPGDLIRLDPGVVHGLESDHRVRWICLG